MTAPQWVAAGVVAWFALNAILVGVWILLVEWYRWRAARRRNARGGHIDHHPNFGDTLAGDFRRSEP